VDEQKAFVVILVTDKGGDSSVHCRAWQVPPDYFKKVEGDLAEVGSLLPEWIWDSVTGQSVLIHSDGEGGTA
jgi:hypothetical protein